MPQIPEAPDFGARPSLRSNRVDLPGAGDISTGEAVAKAANTFAAIYGEKKRKEDRLNYSLAKNELLNADIAQREALRDDEDWHTYDERYATGYNTTRDEVYGRYSLSPDDMQLLDSESDLIRERGRVQVADASRVVKLDNETAKIEANLLLAREQVLNADPATANDIMLTQLESIYANTAWDDTQKEARAQKFVQDTAHGRLIAMEVKDRIAELELSMAKRKARGPISIEDLQAGKGSGSIADFLNKDTVAEMLRKAKDEDKLSTIQGDVFGIIDQVVADFPETDAASLAARKKSARALLDRSDQDYGAKRNFLEQELSERNREDLAIKNLGVTELELEMMDQIRAGTSLGGLSPGDMSLLSPQRQKFIKDFAAQWQRDEGYAAASVPEKFHEWYQLSSKEQLQTNLNTAEWISQLDRSDWDRMVREQDAMKKGAETAKDPNIYRGDPDDELLKNMLVGGPHSLFDRIPAPGKKDYDRYLRIDGAVNRALTDASLQKYNETGSGYLSPQEVQEITAHTIGQIVYVEGWFSGTPRTQIGLSEEERTSGEVYVDIDEIRGIAALPDSQGNPQNMEQFLRNFAVNGDNVSERDIEKAYFLWISGQTAEAEALLSE